MYILAHGLMLLSDGKVDLFLPSQGPGRLKPNDLDQIICDLEQAAPDIALIHRLRFHLAMEQEDHMTAVDALQRFFDYSNGTSLLSL